MRSARIFFKDACAGILREDEEGYAFAYDAAYLKSPQARAVSLTLPLRAEPYRDKTLFPFFDGLIPEGWLLDVTVENWKLNANDRMGILLAACRDCVGAVSVREEKP